MVTSPRWTFYPHRTVPGALDVVWCHFPLVEFPEQPGPKPRPGLVRRVFNKGGKVYVEVAFGTSKATSYSEYDLYIANVSDMVDAGLPQATIFQLDRTVVLPWAEEWFGIREGYKTPVVGRLNARSQEYLRYLVEHRKRTRR